MFLVFEYVDAGQVMREVELYKYRLDPEGLHVKHAVAEEHVKQLLVHAIQEFPER